MKITKLALLLLFVVLTNTYADKLLHPYNMNFELGVKGLIPEGWYLPFKFEKLGYSAVLNNQEFVKGSNSMQIAFIGEYEEGNFGSVAQRVDAKNYAGKKIIFRIALKTEIAADSSECKIWVKSNLLDGSEGTISTSDALTSPGEWNYFQIESDINKNAESISFGITLMGKGLILVDDASIEYLQSEQLSIVKDESELSEQSLLNLTAFTKIVGYIRYFYPAIELKDFNWEDFALTGTEFIENAKDKNELSDKLNKLFKPLAPATKISTKANKKKLTNPKPKNALDNIALSWLHVGADLDINLKFLRNVIQNHYIPTRAREAPAIQIIDASAFRGKKIRFSVWAKASIHEPDGHGQIWIGIDGPENQMAVMETNAKNPIKSNKWEQYGITAQVPDNANVMRLGLVLLGDGQILFDNPELIIEGETKNFIKNQGFEELTSFEKIPSWTFPESAVRAGYSLALTAKNAYKDKQALTIFSDEESRIKLPKFEEIFEDEVIPGIFIQMPLTLFVDSLGTLPKSTEKIIQSSKEENFIFSSEDRYSRLALTALLWNVYKQFGLDIDKNLKWDEVLTTALSSIAKVNSDQEVANELNIMITKINDGQSRVWINNDELHYGLPILWKFVEGKLIVSKIHGNISDIELTSEIIEINGLKVFDAIEREKKTITGNTENWKTLRALAKLRTGSINQNSVKIKVLTPAGKVKEFTLQQNIPATELTEDRPPQFYKIQDDHYYLDLTKITERGMKNLVNEMKVELPKAKLMIFDLRGQTSTTDELLGLFIKDAIKSITRQIPVFVRPNAQPSPFLNFRTEIMAKNPRINAKLFFLVDERTAGQAEVIAALAKHYKLGTLIGTTTSGTADEIFGINLPGNFSASIIGMKAIIEDSKIDFKKGIEPDVFVKQTIEGIIQERDEILEAVILELK